MSDKPDDEDDYDDPVPNVCITVLESERLIYFDKRITFRLEFIPFFVILLGINTEQISASAVPNVTKSGLLEKEGLRVHNWKTRYFVLSGWDLYYFKNPKVY